MLFIDFIIFIFFSLTPLSVGLPNNSYKPITNKASVRARLCELQKGCTRLAAASDKVYLLDSHAGWFSPDTPVSSNIRTERHDILWYSCRAVVGFLYNN
jgi:hypothetical protein